jgi:hypothetical protein
MLRYNHYYLLNITAILKINKEGDILQSLSGSVTNNTYYQMQKFRIYQKS